MRGALAIALLLPMAASAQLVTYLHFQDGSLEICPSTSFVYSYESLNVQVVGCEPDEIFKNGFEQ